MAPTGGRVTALEVMFGFEVRGPALMCGGLVQIVTNAGRANTVAASEAAAPTLRRIERAAIAAATPISYHSR